jgi:hypothetical protein
MFRDEGSIGSSSSNGFGGGAAVPLTQDSASERREIKAQIAEFGRLGRNSR